MKIRVKEQIDVISEVFGHLSVNTTEIYLDGFVSAKRAERMPDESGCRPQIDGF